MKIVLGVPQGAIWSPILFDLFVRNVPLRVKNALSLFYADDLTLIKRVGRNQRLQAAKEIEEDLERLNQFGKEWLLEFETTKTQGLIISNKHDKDLNPPMKMGESIVEEGEDLKVLGFVFDRKCNWSKHCEAIAKQARQRLGAIKRIQNYLDDQGIVTAYKAFVRSKLEYGNLVYWGAAESNLKKLDSIQDSTKSMLRNKNHFLPDLEDRRKAAALGLTCKLMDGNGRGQLQKLKPKMLSEDKLQVRRPKRLNSKCHQHQVADQTTAKSLNIFQRSYRGRISKIWNNLDDDFLNDKDVCFQDHRKKIQKKMTSG